MFICDATWIERLEIFCCNCSCHRILTVPAGKPAKMSVFPLSLSHVLFLSSGISLITYLHLSIFHCSFFFALCLSSFITLSIHFCCTLFYTFLQVFRPERSKSDGRSSCSRKCPIFLSWWRRKWTSPAIILVGLKCHWVF